MTASPARERILETAFRLFYARGIRAVGVDLIIAESGVAKATFYKHFPAKDELVLAYLDKVDGIWTGQLQAAAEAAGSNPADQLVGLFDALGTACRRDGYRGCAFINAAAEAVPGTPVHVRTVAHKRAVLAWLGDLTARAGADDPSTWRGHWRCCSTVALRTARSPRIRRAPRAAQQAARALIAASARPSSVTRSVPRQNSLAPPTAAGSYWRWADAAQNVRLRWSQGRRMGD
ncbi:MAG: TetR/AcrR family transcriptional regulator [Nakamurella multipartita]